MKMTLFQENALQIFLTLYYGQLLGTFIFDYIVRSSIEILYANYEWNMLTYVVLGIIFCIAVGWALMATWSKNRRQLVITTIVLISIFIVRLIVGIPSLMEKRGYYFDRRQYSEELTVFILQMAIHFAGIAATWVLAAKQTPII